MKLWPILIVLLAFTSLRLEAAQDSPFEIAVENAAAPWSNNDGTGFANDIVLAAFKAVNIDVKLNVQSYARCKAKVMSGTAIACLSMSYSPEFKDTVIFSKLPLFTCVADYYYNLKKPLTAKKESDLRKGDVVGVVFGYEYPKSFEQIKTRGVRVSSSNSEIENLKKLALGHIDYALINHGDIKPAAVMIDQAQVSGQIGFAFNSGVLESYIGFSAKDPRGEWLRGKFDEGYGIIIKNGTANSLSIKWIRKFSEQSGMH